MITWVNTMVKYLFNNVKQPHLAAQVSYEYQERVDFRRTGDRGGRDPGRCLEGQSAVFPAPNMMIN